MVYLYDACDQMSQASYRYTILWVAFLDPSDSYFLFADLVGFYSHWTYMHICRHIFLKQEVGISRNLMGSKTLPMIWGTYMKLVTKYQISAIHSCWEKCDDKCAYMFNVNKNQLSRQTGSRNLTDPKTLPTIWYTYMMLVSWEAFFNPSDSYLFLLPVCQLCWFLYTLNIYAHFSSHFSQ
jgi:hypothetical protein